MGNLESYQHSADLLCKRYLDDPDEFSIDIAELLNWANYDGFYHSVVAYIEVKHPEVYKAHFAWEDE